MSCLRCPEKGQEGVQRGRTRTRLGRAAPLADRSCRWSSRLLPLPHISRWSTQGLLRGQIPRGRGRAAGVGCAGGAPQPHPSSRDREDPKHNQGHTKGKRGRARSCPIRLFQVRVGPAALHVSRPLLEPRVFLAPRTSPDNAFHGLIAKGEEMALDSLF